MIGRMDVVIIDLTGVPPGVLLTTAIEPNGEAIGFDQNSLGYFTVSDSAHQLALADFFEWPLSFSALP